jgi:hypothetical protein
MITRLALAIERANSKRLRDEIDALRAELAIRNRDFDVVEDQLMDAMDYIRTDRLVRWLPDHRAQ